MHYYQHIEPIPTMHVQTHCYFSHIRLFSSSPPGSALLKKANLCCFPYSQPLKMTSKAYSRLEEHQVCQINWPPHFVAFNSSQMKAITLSSLWCLWSQFMFSLLWPFSSILHICIRKHSVIGTCRNHSASLSFSDQRKERKKSKTCEADINRFLMKINILDWFLDDHATLKTGELMLKIKIRLK